MPRKPKRSCSWLSCPELVVGRYCEEHQKLSDQQYNRYRRDPKMRKHYGRIWRKIRKLYMTAHPLCEECKRQGMMTAAEEVHHILPLSQGGTHNVDNLMALCKVCHSKITAEEGGRWESLVK